MKPLLSLFLTVIIAFVVGWLGLHGKLWHVQLQVEVGDVLVLKPLGLGHHSVLFNVVIGGI